ncbi:glycosyl transferase, group 1 [Magnetococcus marinus MC-1]|uniref:Glycosyl transferase, group 1 n=1 Tax=Magnetococcus marinus (strain ATCC BAA-1437 / JCM 17883 / MC-1) TaxID=156889 RepID=A0LAC3_MAGMM|nr:glycosyltransferase [Magnetococcus marinus]ABK44916.1 glycosyl transferase, group 1 [Magnetococcus marinus MC-1]
MTQSGILFIQERASKGGAQSALARLLSHPQIQAQHPLLLTAAPGWLTQRCQELGIPVLIQPFPRSRSLAGRLWQNRRFARRVAQALTTMPHRPQWVHGNNHLEGLLTLQLAQQLGAQSALFLRAAGMQQRDFSKYQCDRCQHRMVVGEGLWHNVQRWHPSPHNHLVHDGLLEQEFCPIKPPAALFPTKILVIGSPLPAKGWQDVATAAALLDNPPFSFDYCGQPPSNWHASHGQHRFIGFHEDFITLVQGYDLVLNPSHQESFGLAALEVIAAGIPLLSSRCGVIEQVIDTPDFLFPAGDAPALAQALLRMQSQWPPPIPLLSRFQQRLRQQFSMEASVQELLHAHGVGD